MENLADNIKKAISIHSLRMEGDMMRMGKVSDTTKISIHSLRMEGDEISALRFQ